MTFESKPTLIERIQNHLSDIVFAVVITIIFAFLATLTVFAILYQPRHPGGWYNFDISTVHNGETLYLDIGDTNGLGDLLFMNHTLPEHKIQISAPEFSNLVAIRFNKDQNIYALNDGWLSISKYNAIYDDDDDPYQPFLFYFHPIANQVGQFTMTTFNHIKIGICDYKFGSLPNAVCDIDHNTFARPLIFKISPSFQKIGKE